MPVVKVAPKKSTLLKKGTLKTARPKVEVTLPTELSEPSTSIGDFLLWFYGMPGIGKTTLSSKFDRVCHLMFEPGGKALRIHQRVVNNWEEFRAYVQLLIKDQSFATVTIDVVEKAIESCTDYVLKDLGLTEMPDKDYGKTGYKVRREFMKQINSLMKSGKGVIFISHAAIKNRTNRLGEESERITPDLGGRYLEELQGAVDLMGYIYSDGSAIRMQIRDDSEVMAKCRINENFRFTNEKPIKSIPMGDDESEAFESFTKAFNNELQETISNNKKVTIRKK